MIVLVVRERARADRNGGWQWFTADEADALWSRAAAAQRAGSLIGILPCEVPDEIRDHDVTRWLFDNVPELSRVDPPSGDLVRSGPGHFRPVGERAGRSLTSDDLGEFFRGPDGESIWRMVAYSAQPTAALEQIYPLDVPERSRRLDAVVGSPIFSGFRKLTVEDEQ